MIVLASIAKVHAVIDPHYAILDKAIGETLHKVDHNIQFRIVNRSHVSNGMDVLYGVQWYRSYPIHNAGFTAVVNGGKALSFNHTLVVNPEALASGERAIDVLTALKSHFQESYIDPVYLVKTSFGVYEYSDLKLSDEPIVIREKWLLFQGKLVPVTEISHYLKDHSHWYNLRYSASNGKLLDQNDWVIECLVQGHDHSNSVSHSPIVSAAQEETALLSEGSYLVFAMPVESPNHGSRSVVTDPHNTTASPYGWHDVNGVSGAEYTYTRGNNVFASEDRDNNNLPGNSPDGGSTLEFNTEFQMNKSAANYTDAAVVNLFYWNNIMHDVWYQYGFDEESGNFQANNYGNGGLDKDFVNADAQDGSGTNNANFASPPDGMNPRMQMYLWSSGSNSSDYFKVNSPSTAAGKYISSRAAFGKTLDATPVVGDLVVANPLKACSPIINSAQISGNIAFIERGNCLFVDKVRAAEAAGAIAAVIFDSTANNPILMGGTASDITIPVVMIRKTDGQYLKGLLDGGQTVNVSLYDSSKSADDIFDSDFDAGIIAHEYGHGISVRLTGGASNSSCLSNQEQMGEGWSDFFALVMTHAPNAKGTDARGVGTYVINQGTSGSGIRTWPYSTDIATSPYSYHHIKQLSVPHGVGSVWCAMLWDLYWAFIDEYGYDSDVYSGNGGNNMVMQLVIDGLKLQPCNPGFVDGRDAILLADKLNNNGENQLLIWEVFARRGLGFSADQGSSANRSDGVSGFDIPPYLLDELLVEKSTIESVMNGDNLTYTLKAYNLTKKTIKNVSLFDSIPDGLVVDESSLSCGNFQNGVVTISIDSIIPGDSVVCNFTCKANFSSSTEVVFFDDMESGSNGWTVQSDQNSNVWVVSDRRSRSGDSAWYLDNISTQSDQSLIRTLNLTGEAPQLSFWHFYNVEDGWDGGVVELNVDGFWIDAEPYFVLNPYNAAIAVNPASNISGRNAFTGRSVGFINSKIDLSDFKGKTVQIRFRFASDAAASVDGWYIDDVALEDAVAVANTLYVSYDPQKLNTSSTLTFITENDKTSIENTAQLLGLPTLYPNPANNVLYFTWKDVQNFNLVIYDMLGNQIVNVNGSKGAIQIDQFASGSYIAEFRSGNSVVRRKLQIL